MKSLAKILSGLFLAVMIAVTTFQGIANAAPAQNVFAGTWVDLDNATITVTQNQNIITSVKYSNGRGCFQGSEVDLYAPIISVNFCDDAPSTGVLSGNKILWSNGTVWTKK